MSASKPVTAAAIMCLVEDGLLGLNRSFLDYVPELDGQSVAYLEEVRVGDLLCHLSGYDDMELATYRVKGHHDRAPFPGPADGQHEHTNIAIRTAGGAPLHSRPASEMNYSNFGFTLLGDIVRRVSGKPLWQFAHERLFEPLTMVDSHYALPRALRARRVFRKADAPGNEVFGLWRGMDDELNDDLDSGTGGLATTARDMAVFGQMLLNGGIYGGRRVLSPASVATMTRSHVLPDVPQRFLVPDVTTGLTIELATGGGYGYGLFCFEPGDRFEGNGSLMSSRSYGHGGLGGACFWVDPDAELVAVYFSVSPYYDRSVFHMQADLFQNALHAAIVA
ncbi:MAG: serine hydrolase [Mycobacteriales bacterium]